MPHWNIGYFRKRFEDAQARLPVRILLALSRQVTEKEIGGLSEKAALEKIERVRKAYAERKELERSIAEQVAKIDYFYECLKSCESYNDITPLFLPNIASPYYGRAPLGMPYYPWMNPDHILTFYLHGHAADRRHCRPR